MDGNVEIQHLKKYEKVWEEGGRWVGGFSVSIQQQPGLMIYLNILSIHSFLFFVF